MISLLTKTGGRNPLSITYQWHKLHVAGIEETVWQHLSAVC